MLVLCPLPEAVSCESPKFFTLDGGRQRSGGRKAGLWSKVDSSEDKGQFTLGLGLRKSLELFPLCFLKSLENVKHI